MTRNRDGSSKDFMTLAPHVCPLSGPKLGLATSSWLSLKGSEISGNNFFFAHPPAGGSPGEGPDALLVSEHLPEVYGLVAGPPGWCRSLLTAFNEWLRSPSSGALRRARARDS
eukprot:1322584-Pyramimonas_sp.AAC.1